MEDRTPNLTDLADGVVAGPEWERWLVDHPREAAEVEAAQRVRQLVQRLATAEIALPQDFEARLLARISQDQTLLTLIDLWLTNAGGALVELLNVLLSMLPAPVSQPAAT